MAIYNYSVRRRLPSRSSGDGLYDLPLLSSSSSTLSGESAHETDNTFDSISSNSSTLLGSSCSTPIFDISNEKARSPLGNTPTRCRDKIASLFSSRRLTKDNSDNSCRDHVNQGPMQRLAQNTDRHHSSSRSGTRAQDEATHQVPGREAGWQC